MSTPYNRAKIRETIRKYSLENQNNSPGTWTELTEGNDKYRIVGTVAEQIMIAFEIKEFLIAGGFAVSTSLHSTFGEANRPEAYSDIDVYVSQKDFDELKAKATMNQSGVLESTLAIKDYRFDKKPRTIPIQFININDMKNIGSVLLSFDLAICHVGYYFQCKKRLFSSSVTIHQFVTNKYTQTLSIIPDTNYSLERLRKYSKRYPQLHVGLRGDIFSKLIEDIPVKEEVKNEESSTPLKTSSPIKRFQKLEID